MTTRPRPWPLLHSDYMLVGMEQAGDEAGLRPWRASDMQRLANDLAFDGAYIAPQSRLRQAQSGNPYANAPGNETLAPLIIDVHLPPYDGPA